MSWKAELELEYRLEDGRVRAMDRHHGPLRVLKALPLPQGPGCEHVLVHPPGGLAGGDELRVRVRQAEGTRVRLTTPGATRLYRSTGAWALQEVDIEVACGALLEWLPLETLAYAGCRARSRVQARLQPGAMMVGWDVACLGLPASGDGWSLGVFEQHLEVQGAWLERAELDAKDMRLRDSPLGLDGQPVWASMWCAAGSAWPESVRQSLVEVARQSDTSRLLAATSPGERVVVVRVLASRVEPVFEALRRVRRAWLPLLGHDCGGEPRVWAT